VAERFEGLPEVCTHPKQAIEHRATNLRAGLDRLGIGDR
jgi:hypothetical protein